MVVLDYICSTLGNLHCFVIAVVCFCLGAHWKIVGEGLWRHIAVEPLLPAAWIVSHLTLLGLTRSTSRDLFWSSSTGWPALLS